jgi:hypothetical protein
MPDQWPVLILLVVLGLAGGIVSLVRTIGEDPMRVKHFAVGLGIALLLPLSVYYAVALVRPAPNEEVHGTRLAELDERIRSAKAEPQKEGLRGKKRQLERQHEEQKKRHEQLLFPIGYLVGISTIILGTLTGVRGVSVGALFGGLFTLTYACFSYWDTMADWLRFVSLVGALALLTALGWWRFGAEGSADPVRNGSTAASNEEGGREFDRQPGSQGGTERAGRRAPAA